MTKIDDARKALGVPVEAYTGYILKECVVKESGRDVVISGEVRIFPRTAFPRLPSIDVICDGESTPFNPGSKLGRFTQRVVGRFEIVDYYEPAHRSLPIAEQHQSRERVLYAFLDLVREVEDQKSTDETREALGEK